MANATRYDLILWFGSNSHAMTTVMANSKEDATILAKKKFSHKNITRIIFVDSPTINSLGF